MPGSRSSQLTGIIPYSKLFVNEIGNILQIIGDFQTFLHIITFLAQFSLCLWETMKKPSSADSGALAGFISVSGIGFVC